MSIVVERDEEITTVTIDRAQVRNAVDRTTAEALAEAFREFETDDNQRVAVLRGAGGNFCAGADLKAMAEGRPNRIAADGDGPMGPSRMVLSKPVIAAISGYAVAGGLELALWCDLRVMEEDAALGVFCRRWGVPLVDGGTVRLPAIVGLGRALDLILTGREVGAEEALAIGLVNRVVPQGEALSEARALARTLAGFPQDCLRSDRASAYESVGLPFGEAMQREFVHGQRALRSPELLQGAKRFAHGAGRGGKFE